MNQAKIISCYESFASVFGRLLLGGLFLMAGIGKITDFGGTAAYMSSMGVPLVTIALILTIIIEAIGGAALIAGYRVKFTAFILGGFTILVTLAMHTDFSVEGQDMLFMKNLMIIGGLLVMSVVGGGKCSMDSRKK